MDENKKETKKVTLNDLKDVSGGLPIDGAFPRNFSTGCYCNDCHYKGKLTNNEGKCPSCGSKNITIS